MLSDVGWSPAGMYVHLHHPWTPFVSHYAAVGNRCTHSGPEVASAPSQGPAGLCPGCTGESLDLPSMAPVGSCFLWLVAPLGIEALVHLRLALPLCCSPRLAV